MSFRVDGVAAHLGGSYTLHMDKKNILLQIWNGGIKECGRLVANFAEGKFNLSKKESVMYASPNKEYYDGEDGSYGFEIPVDKYISREIKRNPDFFPKRMNLSDAPFLKERVHDMERRKYGQPLDEMSVEEFLRNPTVIRELFAEAPSINELFAK